MATITPLAYNTGASIDGTSQYGNLAVGDTAQDYGAFPSGARFWATPDQDLGYVIATEVPSGNQPDPLSIPAYVGFYRSAVLTEESFVELSNQITEYAYEFTTGSEAKSWLEDNGYWTSYGSGGISELIMNWNIQNLLSYSGSGSTINDLRGNSTGTIYGSSIYDLNKPNFLIVNGDNTHYIQSNNDLNSYLNPPINGTDISVFTWVYPMSNNGVILSEQGTAAPPDGGWYDSQIELVSGQLKFRVWGGAPVNSTISIPNGNWYYVGFTYNSTTNILTGYVNGQSAGTQSVNRDSPGNNGYSLYYNLGYPTRTNMGSNAGNYFRFGQLQVFNYGLTGPEVLTNYNNSSSAYLNNLVMALNATNTNSYPGSGTNWFDMSGLGHNGTMTNVTYSSVSGGTMVFNGTNGVVPINQPIPSNSSFTIGAWVYANNVSLSHNIVSSASSPFWVNGGTLSAGIANNYTYVNSPSFPTNQWKFVTVTFNDTTNTMKLYVNGVLVDTNTNATASYTAENTFIGAHYNGSNVSFWNGYIPQVYIFTNEVSGTDVLGLFNLTKSTYGL